MYEYVLVPAKVRDLNGEIVMTMTKKSKNTEMVEMGREAVSSTVTYVMDRVLHGNDTAEKLAEVEAVIVTEILKEVLYGDSITENVRKAVSIGLLKASAKEILSGGNISETVREVVTVIVTGIMADIMPSVDFTEKNEKVNGSVNDSGSLVAFSSEVVLDSDWDCEDAPDAYQLQQKEKHRTRRTYARKEKNKKRSHVVYSTDKKKIDQMMSMTKSERRESYRNPYRFDKNVKPERLWDGETKREKLARERRNEKADLKNYVGKVEVDYEVFV